MQLNDQIKRILKILIFAFLCAEMQTSKSNTVMDLLILDLLKITVYLRLYNVFFFF